MKRLARMTTEGNPAVRMVLPMAEAVVWLKQGAGELIRQAGVKLLRLTVEQEVRELAGGRGKPQADRQAHRWGAEDGYLRGDGAESADPAPHHLDATSTDGADARARRAVVLAQFFVGAVQFRLSGATNSVTPPANSKAR